MALELSSQAENLLNQTAIEGNIVLEVEGFDFLFGSTKVLRSARIGGFNFGDGTLIGGTTTDKNSKDYISLKGTTTNINQKIDFDRGGGSSITSFNINMIDKNNELSELFSPGGQVDDVLGNGATVYFTPGLGNFEKDRVRLFVGVVSSLSFGSGNMNCRVDHPLQLSRQKLLPQVTTVLNGPITDSQTLIPIESSDGFINEQDNLSLYVRIGDEIIRVQNASSNTLFNCTRGQFGTIPVAHADNDEVISQYGLQGDPIDLALKMMLSEPTNSFFAERTALSFNIISTTERVQNAVFFENVDIQDELGLVVGDFLSIDTIVPIIPTFGDFFIGDGTLIGGTVGFGNLIGFTEIISFGKSSNGSYIVIDAELTDQTDVQASIKFKSKYNTLNFGCGKSIRPYNVDVEQFESLNNSFGSQFFDYDFFLKDEIDFKEFLEDMLYASSMFSLPRKGRISAGISAAPLVGLLAKTIDSSNVLNASKLKITRSINDSFYNSIVYKFNEDQVLDRFKGAQTTLSSDSINRINIGNRTLTIEAPGIRESELNRSKMTNLSDRFLDRFQFAAEKIELETNFKTFSIEPGDTCILDGNTLSITDISTRSREFIPRVMECVNKSVSLTTGKIKLTLADLNQQLNVRYATVSPSSQTGVGSSGTDLIFKTSYSTESPRLERDKWVDYVGQKITIRNEDYTLSHTTFLLSLDLSNPFKMIIQTPPSFTVLEDFIIECPVYDDASKFNNSYWKSLHGFWNPQVQVVNGDNISFEVNPSDIDKFFVNGPLDIHTEDYSQRAITRVSNIDGNTVTISEIIGFNITSSFVVDLIGFRDEGLPYGWY